MGRVYFVAINSVAVTGAQDLVEISPGDDKPVKILGAVATVADSETNEQFTCTVQRRTGAWTPGSGGTTPTPAKQDTQHAAAGFAVKANNTARATGGTQEICHAEGWPSQGGFGYTPVPGTEPLARQTEGLIVGLETAPTASTNFNITVTVEET